MLPLFHACLVWFRYLFETLESAEEFFGVCDQILKNDLPNFQSFNEYVSRYLLDMKEPALAKYFFEEVCKAYSEQKKTSVQVFSPTVVIELLDKCTAEESMEQMDKDSVEFAKELATKVNFADLFSASSGIKVADVTKLVCALVKLHDDESLEKVLKSTIANEGIPTLEDADIYQIIDVCVQSQTVKCALTVFKLAKKSKAYTPTDENFNKVLEEAIRQELWLDAQKILIRMMHEIEDLEADDSLYSTIFKVVRAVIGMESVTDDPKDSERKARKLFDASINAGVFDIVGSDMTRVDLSKHDYSPLEMTWCLKYRLKGLYEDTRDDILCAKSLIIKVATDKKAELTK